MPLYDYDCAACRRRFEVIHGVHTEGPEVCPICGSGPIRKAISAAAVHFKGSGWAKKERRATATPATAKAGDSSSSESGAMADERNEGSGSGSTSNEGSGSGSTSTTAVKPVETGTAAKTG
jgi:putative FmdB family regulatory protein